MKILKTYWLEEDDNETQKAKFSPLMESQAQRASEESNPWVTFMSTQTFINPPLHTLKKKSKICRDFNRTATIKLLVNLCFPIAAPK